MKMVYDGDLSEPIRFGLEKLRGMDVAVKLGRNAALKPQAYRRALADGAVQIEAADDAGFLYALLDLADLLRKGEEVGPAEVTPYLENRGVKFNIPLDARTPSYSDASTSATKNIPHMWETEFWHEFLDRMAENKYNVLSLWTLSPFPSLVRIPEFPEACLDDVKITTRSFHAALSGKGIYDEDHRRNLVTVKRLTIDEKIRFWQEIMQYAADRCIRVYLFTWNLFVYGTEDSNYGITEEQNNPVTRRFVYCGTKALMETYPLLAGIGVTAGENMTYNGADADENEDFSQTDIGFIAETYGRGIADYLAEHPERRFVLIHRMQMARYDKIMEAYREYPGEFAISFKYSQAHMYSSVKPAFIRDFLAEKAKGVRVWLTLRNDDYYMYRWGNPEFAREYLRNMPTDCMAGFYMGADGFTWGRDYMTRGDETHPLFVDKMWYLFRIWGQLSYDLSLGREHFVGELQARFSIPAEKAEVLYEAWKEASSIIPELNCAHWHDYDFQWYPEGCCMHLHAPVDKLVFANINEFVQCPAMPGGENLSVRDYAACIVKGEPARGVTPDETAQSMRRHAERALARLPELRGSSRDLEFKRTLEDIETMSVLGQYYALKEEAAVSLAVYRLSGDRDRQKAAIEKLSAAAEMWKVYSRRCTDAYIPQVLDRLCGKVDVREFDAAAELDIALAGEEWGGKEFR